MSRNNYLSEAEFLEDSRVKLENMQTQPILSTILTEYGYNTEKISEGTGLLAKALEAYNFRKKEDYETSEAYGKFKTLYNSIGNLYSKDRKKAKILFEKQADVLLRLGINGSMPKAYVKWYEVVNTYYTTCLAEEEIQTSLATLKCTAEHLNKQKTGLDKLQHLRADYLREKGESQDATASKDTAFANLDDWMREFKAIAKIALEEHPQLLEALGIKA